MNAFENASKHPNNFAVTLAKQHFIHAPVDWAVISQLPGYAYLCLAKKVREDSE